MITEMHDTMIRDDAEGCPSADISAYIDGELSALAESSFERHIASCRICARELNEQKQFVNALNLSLSSAPEIPLDFTKRIITNAESGVSGLRKSKERMNAVFVAAALFFFAVFALGAGAPNALATVFEITGRLFAVIAFSAHFLFDISTGVIILLRAVSVQPAISISAFSLGILIVASVAFVFRSSRANSHNGQLESGNTP